MDEWLGGMDRVENDKTAINILFGVGISPRNINYYRLR